MKSPGAARAGTDSLLGRRVHMLRVRLREGSLWPIHCPHMAVKVTVIKQFLCTQKNRISIWPLETARPAARAASHGCLCAAWVSSVKRGCAGLPRHSIAGRAFVRQSNLGESCLTFSPCLSGTNAHVSLLERERSTDRRPRLSTPLRRR